MKGTEKQIAWAEDIINKVKTICEKMEEANAGQKGIEKVKEMHAGIIKNLNESYAGNVIEDFKDLEVTGNMEKDYKALVSQIKVNVMYNQRDYRKEPQL